MRKKIVVSFAAALTLLAACLPVYGGQMETEQPVIPVEEAVKEADSDDDPEMETEQSVIPAEEAVTEAVSEDDAAGETEQLAEISAQPSGPVRTLMSPEEFLAEFTRKYPELAGYLSKLEPSSYPLTGLAMTKSIYTKGEHKGETGETTDMTPQGVVVTDQYVLVSAYSKSHKFHSVLWVIDRYTGDYVKTVVLEGRDHVGGIAFDDSFDRIWITCTAGKGNNAAVGYISVQEIEDYDLERDGTFLKYERKYILEELPRTSFLTVDDGYMYSGCFRSKADGTLCIYHLDQDGFLKAEERETKAGSYLSAKSYKRISIPDEIQGITMDDGFIVLSQSYGAKDSHLMVYENPHPDKLENLTKQGEIADITAPPFLEQIFLDGPELFALFESFASAYLNRPNVLHIDHVMEFTVLD